MSRPRLLSLAAAFALAGCAAGGPAVRPAPAPAAPAAGTESQIGQAPAGPTSPTVQTGPTGPADHTGPTGPTAAPTPPAPRPPAPEKIAAWSERLGEIVARLEAPAFGPASPRARAARARLMAWVLPTVDPRALQASALETLGDARRALALLERLVAENPAGPAVCRYAALAVREGKSGDAEAFLGSCAERDAGNPELRGVLGWIFLASDEPGKARPHLEATWGTRAAERYAVFLGRARLAAGDLDGALEAARLGTRHGETAAEAWTLVGEVQRVKGLAAPAEEAYARALELRPGDYAASVDLGVLRLGQGKPAEAEALFAAAAKGRPGEPEAWTNLGLARRAQGDYKGAREALEKALAADPTFAPALKNLGLVHEKYLGRPADALPYYDRYLAVRPGDAEVERWRKAAARLTGGGGAP